MHKKLTHKPDNSVMEEIYKAIVETNTHTTLSYYFLLQSQNILCAFFSPKSKHFIKLTGASCS